MSEAPSIVWTGGGYVVVIPYILGKDTGSWHKRENYRTRIVSLDPAGVVRESFELDEQPTMHPKIVWAGGRVAITWVRPIPTPSGDVSQSYLLWLDCAQ